jgi:hypothetical protein
MSTFDEYNKRSTPQELVRDFDVACVMYQQERPVYMRPGCVLADNVERTWAMTALKLLTDQSKIDSWGREHLNELIGFADSLLHNEATQLDVDVLQRTILATRNIYETNVTARNIYHIVNNTTAEERCELFAFADRVFASPQHFHSPKAGNFIDDVREALGTSGTEGGFQLLSEVAAVYNRLGAAPQTDEQWQRLLAVGTTAFNQHMIDGFGKGAQKLSTAAEIDTLLGDLLAFAVGKELYTDFTLGMAEKFRKATGGLPLGLNSFRQPTPEAKVIMKSFARTADMAEGFGADEYMGRRPGKGERSLYDCFGTDIANVRLLNQSDRNGFPGPGLIIQNIDLASALKAHLASEGDSLAVYKRIWGEGVGEGLQDLPEARFFISRAMIAITGPNKDQYLLKPLRDKPAVSYSLIAFNVNHGNESNEIVVSVPTAILDAKFANCSVQVQPEIDLPEPLLDINEAGLRIAELQLAAREMGYPLIRVGSPAILAGSMEYAIDPDHLEQDLPLWQVLRNRQHERINQDYMHWDRGRITDVYGHEIPSTIDDYYLQAIPRSDLVPTDLHSRIMEHTTGLLDLWQGVKYIRANWSKGNTGGTAVDVDFTQAEFEEALADRGLPPNWNRSAVRMLVEAYKWNSLRSVDNNDPNSFPVLVAASSRWYSQQPRLDGPFIDTYSGPDRKGGLAFVDRMGRAFHLDSPSKGRSLEDAVFFVEHVLQFCNNDAVELRFVDRRAIQWQGV